MKNITFLGPVGATFSHQAYRILSNRFGAPADDGINALVPASSNEDIVKMIIAHGGYGSIAMETRAEGRVEEPLESFIELLESYEDEVQCPLRIIGSIKMKITFALMARKGMSVNTLKGVLAHPKALGACKTYIHSMNIPAHPSVSNGKAAEDIATSEIYAEFAALGPALAAEKYGLEIIGNAEGLTTFFLLGPRNHVEIAPAEENRCLILFKTLHVPGAIVDALMPFKRAGINLIRIHSVDLDDRTSSFAVEAECSKPQLSQLDQALKGLRLNTKQSIVFGPFGVLSE